jgi:hypothetical protein
MRKLIFTILSVMRMEMRKTFFARRGLWVYLLALAPILPYLGHSIYTPRERHRLEKLAAAHPIPTFALRLIREDMTTEEVVAKLGKPYATFSRHHRHEEGRMQEFGVYKYTDGKSDYFFRFVDGKLTYKRVVEPVTLAQDILIFATVFQSYFLRLAIFFGCAGIFMNLFRGEMLDKSLHFYLLTPIPREALMTGKYLAGLIATVVIFAASTALQLPAMFWQFRGPELTAYLAGPGWHHFAAYLGITALACVGYGSIFLAAGLLFRSPIVPAAVILVWESVSIFVPASLKQFSLIYYLQSLCPVVAPPDNEMPMLLKFLISPADPAGTTFSIAAIAVIALIVLVVAGLRSRTLEINYSAD